MQDSSPQLACAGCGEKCARMYCSNACKLRVWKAKNPDAHLALRKKHQGRKVSAYFTGYCACGQPMGGRKRHAACPECTADRGKAQAKASARTKAEARHRQDAKVTACAECGCRFCPLYGSSNSLLCGPCSYARARAHKAMHRTLRKARQRAVQVEPVNPLKVFERDGWRCRLCGVPTPRAKRGACDADAPELDHIVPLGKRGAHSYANTQCACRRCNAMKSDRLDWEAKDARGAFDLHR